MVEREGDLCEREEKGRTFDCLSQFQIGTSTGWVLLMFRCLFGVETPEAKKGLTVS